jgi:hypothetical protein
MASKTNRTSDGKHVQFGENDPLKLPEGFNAPDDGEFEPNYFGRVMVNPNDGGFGAAYIEPDED